MNQIFSNLFKATKSLWPILECLLIPFLLNFDLDGSLATFIVVSAFMFFVNFTYKKGYYIRIVGWGFIGLLMGVGDGEFHLLINVIMCIVFIGVRYLFSKLDS